MNRKNSIKKITSALFILATLFFLQSSGPREIRVLVFSKTQGYRHASIKEGTEAIQKLGAKYNFKVDTTENALNFNEQNLKQYSAVIFLNTSAEILYTSQEAAFERYIQAGGGFVGIHAASDTEYNWHWYGNLVGAYFSGHPQIQGAALNVVNTNDASTKMLPLTWKRTDEWYNFKLINPDINVLIKLDEKSYQGGTNGDNHPFSWYHEYDGGRAFYTAGGHTSESYSEPLFLDHLWGGIQYAIGKNQELDYNKVKSQYPPEENRFYKRVLGSNLDEPTELTVFKDGKLLFFERKGAVKLYDPKTDNIRQIGKFNVFTENENGLIGLSADPNYEKNKWIYVYYSPLGNFSENRLSRFVFDHDSIHFSSEKIILKVVTQRKECCHTGGSITFDRQGNLYLSTGDNTNPFASKGFAPIDEGPGREAWDAQGSSANTNDLRGKILRIHPEPDGSYTIPQGNLFPPNTDKTRPEIYIMGNRNPYRISVDQKTGFLYWGEIGPDAGENDDKRGPRGHDEVNQARKAGFYGWPYFVGDNKAYVEYNFKNDVPGKAFDPANPINNSPNNTGLTNLPPAQKAFIWYPYAASYEFPFTGKGGRNAMAGEIFYSDAYQKINETFPDYYDGKLFIYDWIRGWINVVTMDEKGDFYKVEPFMPGTYFDHPMDMQFANDGTLYLLQYGPKWFVQNETAELIKITYNGGNRKPVAKIEADKTIGAAPLTVQFSAQKSIDYDKDKLTYEWKFPNSNAIIKGPASKFTFATPGVYKPTLIVTDSKGEKVTATIEIKVGNESPQVDIEVPGNKSFFWEKTDLKYSVKVKDKEDGSLENGKISPSKVNVSFNYLPEGYDLALVEAGHQTDPSQAGGLKGKKMIELSDCKACHTIQAKSVGPAYIDVAKKYKNDNNALTYLSEKIIKGGGGVWGEHAMSAHPQLTKEETKEMVKYILSLADEKPASATLPVTGKISFNRHSSNDKNGTYILQATYTDKGGKIVGPISSQKTLVFRNPTIKVIFADTIYKAVQASNKYLTEEHLQLVDECYFGFKNIDLTDIEKIVLKLIINKQESHLDILIDSPTGEKIGEVDMNEEVASLHNLAIPLKKPASLKGYHDIYFVSKNSKFPNKVLVYINEVFFQKTNGK